MHRCRCVEVTVSFLLIFCVVSHVARAQAIPRIDDEPNNDQPILALDTGGHTNGVYKLMVSDYTRQIVSVGIDKTIRLWDLESGEPARVLRPPVANGVHGYLFSAALAPDGKLLAVGTYRALTPLHDHRVQLIDITTGEIVASLKGHIYTIYDLAYSPDGERLASASQDKTVRIWNVATGETLKVLEGHEALVHGVAWSPDGKQVVTGSYDKTARIWSVASGKTIAVMRDSQGDINTVAWRPDGKVIATGGSDKSIRLYDTAGKLIYQWSKLPNQVFGLKFSVDSKRLLYTYGSDTLPPIGADIVDMTTGKQLVHYEDHKDSPISCAFTPDGKRAITGDSIGCIRVWDSTNGTTVRKLDGRGKTMRAAGWSPDGQAIAWGTTDNGSTDLGGPLERTFCLKNLDFGPPPDKSFVRAKAKLGDLSMGFQIGAGPIDMRKILFLRNGDVISRFTSPQPIDQVSCYTLLPDGRAALGSHDGVYLFDTKTSSITKHLSERGETVLGMAPSPDNRYILTANIDQIMRVWNVDTGKLVVALFVSNDDEWIAWTSEGYYAASFAGERLMGWHINTGPESMSDFFPASRFHKSLYRPDVIQRLLEGGSLARAIEIADREQVRKTQVTHVKDLLPGDVKITEPAQSQLEDADGKVTIRARAEMKANQPVTSMRVIVNGRPYGPARAVAAPTNGEQKKEEQSAELWLPPGRHNIAVKAETESSVGLSDPVEVTRPPEGNEPQPKLHVLEIGGGSDAAALATALAAAKPKEFAEEKPRILQGNDATPEAIVTELERLRKESTLADTTFIYAAGAESLDRGGQYQLSATDDAQEALSGNDLKRLLAPIPGRIVLATDLRRSEQKMDRESTKNFCGENAAEKNNRLDAAADDFFRDLLTEDYGVIVMRTQTPRATADASNSAVLSRSLSDGVSGKADEDGDGVVQFSELSRYVPNRVRELSGGKQSTAIGQPQGVGSFPIAQPRGR
jgi:WD40 repeat protein